MHARTLLAWMAVGLVGLALAAGVTYAATQLSSQRIGLSAEPPSAGQELSPHARRGRERAADRRRDEREHERDPDD
jgi:hypothetical protein